MGTVVHLTDQSIQLSANNWNTAYAALGNFLPLSGGIISGNLTVIGNISATGVGAFNTVALSSVTFTGETITSTTSVTATDTYVKVIANGQTKYLRLFDVI